MNYGKLLLKLIQDEKSKAIFADPKQKIFCLQHQENDFQFQIKFNDIEKYSIVLDSLSINLSTPILDIEIINKRLEEQAEKIQKQITFLLEKFKLIELDTRSKRAQLRSYPPYQNGSNQKFYYEIILEEGVKIHFQRYEFSPENRYQKITSQLTTETFERMVNDFTAILSGRN